MSDAKKPSSAKQIAVSTDDQAPASSDIKPVIIPTRSILKAPGDAADPPADAPLAADKSSTAADLAKKLAPKSTLKPPKPTGGGEAKPEIAAVPAPTADKPAATATSSSDPAPTVSEAANNAPTTDGDKPVDPQTANQAEEQANAAAEAQGKHDEAMQKLVDSKQYFLPINAVEKRKTKHFIVLGAVLSLLLLLAWVDIALDADLIQIPGIKPVTHFFSN